MHQGIYKFHSIEYRGTNDYNKSISVITLETKKGSVQLYAPASLYRDLKRLPDTKFIKFEGTKTSEKGDVYPLFKFAK